MELSVKFFSKKPNKKDGGVEREEKIRSAASADDTSQLAEPPLLARKTKNTDHPLGLTGSMIHKERSVHKIHFKTLASDRPFTNVVTDREIENSQLVLRTVFAPSSPVLNIDYFAGRVKEIKRAVSAIENEKMHLIIHGKRGLGKTSFSNTLCDIAKEAGYIICNTSCSQHSTFSEIFRSFLKEIPLIFDKNFITDHGVDNRQACFDTLLPEGAFSPKELTKVLLRLVSARILFVIDEFDRNQTPNFKDSILETIKNFSDNCVRANLIIIGATDTVDDLIGLNESVRRNITGIPIKVFNEEEISELFDIGEDASNVIFPEAIRKEISSLSGNAPHCMRLLCLHSAQAALSNERWTTTDADILQAISMSIMDVQTLLDNDLLDLVHSKKSRQFEAFLFALACCDCNENNEFYAEQAARTQREQTQEVVTALSIGSRLTMICNTVPPILTKREHRHKVLYRFADPTFGFYLRLLHSYGTLMAKK